jgi:predicted DNA binding protein
MLHENLPNTNLIYNQTLHVRMWISKFIIKHDCILGNRCEKYGVTLQSSNPSVYKEKNKIVSSSMHYMSGDSKKLDQFIKDLSNEKKVLNLERKGDMFFLLEKSTEKAIQFFNPKIIFTRPVLMDKKGYETWEIASWERKIIEGFITNVDKYFDNYKLLKLKEIKIDNVFFPRLMPNLTELQKQAIELAIENGYYKTPRQIDLRKLSKLMKISLSTYQQHLRVAEEKLIPNILNYST